MRSKNPHKYIILLIVWIISAVYVAGFIDRGWIPHDEGSLAQSAERVLAGELPHRDFDEIYTGGLSFLYAATFKFLGANLVSIRYVFFAIFLIFVPALYAIAVRFASPWIAGAVTLLGVTWSVPNYFAGVPSWYNLFFAVLGTIALTRHVETERVGWLFIAGLCGGLSFLTKVTGIYYVLAVCLFFAFREGFLSRAFRSDSTKSVAYTSLKVIACAIFLSSIIFLLRSRLGAMEIFHFLLPTAAICSLLLWGEWQAGYGRFSSRLRTFFGLCLPFGCGVAVPIVLFLIPYLLTNSLGDFVQGVFVLPQKRFQNASMSFPPAFTIVASLPYALLLFSSFATTRSPAIGAKYQVALLLPLVFALSSVERNGIYWFGWQSVRALAVVAVLIGCVSLIRVLGSALVDENQRQILLLVIIMTALLSMVQFPFAASIYFVYIAPLVALALLAAVASQPNAPRILHCGVLVFYLFFAVLWINTGYVWDLGVRYTAYRPASVLDPDRASIQVTDADKTLYTQMLDLIRKHRGSTDYVYATPDCPEVYFLAGMRNPTRKIFDFLTQSESEPAELLEVLRAKNVKVVAINERPHFSGVLSPKLKALLMDHFPFSVDLGQFTVRWKE